MPLAAVLELQLGLTKLALAVYPQRQVGCTAVEESIGRVSPGRLVTYTASNGLQHAERYIKLYEVQCKVYKAGLQHAERYIKLYEVQCKVYKDGLQHAERYIKLMKYSVKYIKRAYGTPHAARV